MGAQVQVRAGQVARWPYIVALISGVLAAVGVVLAPISGITYALGLPGMVTAGVWVRMHREAPAREALSLAAGIMLTGLAMGVAVVLMGRGDAVFELNADPWYEAILMGAMLLLPLTSVALAVVGASYGLGSSTMRRRITHVADLSH